VSRTHWISLVPVQTRGSRRPFYFVNAFGGRLPYFGFLARATGADQPFYVLQSRGMRDGEAPHTRVEDMAADYLAEIRAVQPRGPYAIGGGSAGGVIAYEMAQQLQAAGERVDALILVDTSVVGPSAPRGVESRAAQRLRTLGIDAEGPLGRWLLQPPLESSRPLRTWGGDVLRRVRALGRRSAPSPPAPPVTPGLRAMLEANNDALARYAIRPYPGVATLLLAREEPDSGVGDRRLAWARVVEGGLTVRCIPGDHDTMVAQANAPVLGKILRDCLSARAPEGA
jgi:thioesterase domain-containing protein